MCRKTEKAKKTLQRWGGRSPDKGSFSENIFLLFIIEKREKAGVEGGAVRSQSIREN